MSGKTRNLLARQFLRFSYSISPMIGSKITKMITPREFYETKSKKDKVLILFRDSSEFKSEIHISEILKN